jgi:hypothetical protein
MEEIQHTEAGPTNRLDVQVLENSWFPIASREYTSVQSPQRRLTRYAKPVSISQIMISLL